MFLAMGLMLYHACIITLIGYPLLVLSKIQAEEQRVVDHDNGSGSDHDHDHDSGSSDGDSDHDSDDSGSSDDEIDALIARIHKLTKGIESQVPILIGENDQPPIANQGDDEKTKEVRDRFFTFLDQATPLIESIIGPEEASRLRPRPDVVTGTINELAKLNLDQLGKLANHSVQTLGVTLDLTTASLSNEMTVFLNHLFVDNNKI